MVAIAGGASACVALFWRNGRQYRETLNEVYVRDPDELGVPPAVAGCVNRFYETHPDDLAATAIDLVARGVVELHDDPGARVSRSLLSLRRERATGLWPHEVACLSLLLAPCGRRCPLTSLDVLHRLGWRDRRAYDDRLWAFGDCVGEEVRDLGLEIEPYGFVAAQAVGAIAVAMLVLDGIASGLTQMWVFEVVGLAFAIFAVGFDRMWYRRTHPGRILQLRCERLRRYWHDFGRLGEKHIDEVELWGRHLAFAVALGDASLARAELHDRGEWLVRLVDALVADKSASETHDADGASGTRTGGDDGASDVRTGDDAPGQASPADDDDDMSDWRIAEWLKSLDLPESVLAGMDR